MRILFACGGTAGHVNPAIGVAGRIKELIPDAEILFIGANGKMEMELVPKEGYAIRGIPVSNLSRSLSRDGVIHNIQALKDMKEGSRQSREILREFKPDVVVGTGGYVCYPVLKEAAHMGIPTAVHESNAEPGLTTRLLENLVDVIMVGFEEARKNYRHPEKVRVTGTPVRLGFMRSDREMARKALGLSSEEPLVLSVWGSLGATDMNMTVARIICLAMKDRPFRMLHSAGKRGIGSMTKFMEEGLHLEGWNEAGLEVRDYIFDMPLWMEAADVVLCRSGASTLAELAAVGKPAILVPSPNVVHNHQEKNARVLEHAGAARVLVENGLTAETIYENILDMLSDRERLAQMADNMRHMAVENATDEITSIVLSLTAQEEE